MYVVKTVIDGKDWYLYGYDSEDRCISLTDVPDRAYSFHDKSLFFLIRDMLSFCDSEFSLDLVPGL